MDGTASLSPNLTRIHLGGKLGKLFGKLWTLDVKSPAEAIKAIDANTRGEFTRYLRLNGERKFYKVALQKKDQLIGADELKHRSGKSDIWIMPTIRGASSGWAKIIAGVILVIVGVITYAYGGGALIGYGASLIFGGITQLLTPIPKKNQQPQSTNFQGNATSVQQGACIPLLYGRCLVRPTPVCVSFDSADTQATSNTTIGTVDTLALIGGSVQYSPGDPVSAISSNDPDA